MPQLVVQIREPGWRLDPVQACVLDAEGLPHRPHCPRPARERAEQIDPVDAVEDDARSPVDGDALVNAWHVGAGLLSRRHALTSRSIIAPLDGSRASLSARRPSRRRSRPRARLRAAPGRWSTPHSILGRSHDALSRCSHDEPRETAHSPSAPGARPRASPARGHRRSHHSSPPPRSRRPPPSSTRTTTRHPS